jgi:hypothetical protein
MQSNPMVLVRFLFTKKNHGHQQVASRVRGGTIVWMMQLQIFTRHGTWLICIKDEKEIFVYFFKIYSKYLKKINISKKFLFSL